MRFTIYDLRFTICRLGARTALSASCWLLQTSYAASTELELADKAVRAPVITK
jgi:hypothetical protein